MTGKVSKPFLVIGTPEVGPPHWSYVKSLLGLVVPGPWQFYHQPGYGGVDEACNDLVEFFLNSPAEWFLLVASDATLHPGTVKRLLSWGKPLVAALSFVRHLPTVATAQITEGDTGTTSKILTRWLQHHPELIRVGSPSLIPERPDDALVAAERFGTHVMLSHRSVYEALDRPWFLNAEAERGGEDYYFIRKARKAGFIPYVDLSVVAGHTMGDWSIGALEFLVWNQVTDWENGRVTINTLRRLENGTNN